MRTQGLREAGPWVRLDFLAPSQTPALGVLCALSPGPLHIIMVKAGECSGPGGWWQVAGCSMEMELAKARERALCHPDAVPLLERLLWAFLGPEAQEHPEVGGEVPVFQGSLALGLPSSWTLAPKGEMRTTHTRTQGGSHNWKMLADKAPAAQQTPGVWGGV